MGIEHKIGEKFEGTRLTYLGEIKGKTKRTCKFKCDCGTIVEKPFVYVRYLNTVSCGCLRRETTAKKNTTHGHAARNRPSGAYRSWQAMHQRILVNPKYKNRKINERWCGDDGFKNFLADMGERPNNHSIERIDNNKGYEPSNCKWAIKKEQNRNTTQVKYIEYEGKMYPQSELIEKFGVTYRLVKQRRKRGMGLLESIITPINKTKQNGKKWKDTKRNG